MKNSTISKQCSNTTDLYSTNAAKSHRLSMLWLMLLTLLLGPTRMVAQTTTDPRCALFNNLDGITDVTITDNSGNPWQMLDLNAEGMTNLGFDIPKGSKGLMSSNYNKDYSISEAFVKFKVEKPMLLTFKYLVSSKKSDQATITLDSKTYGTISEKKQIEIKALLSVGNHSLVLSYRKDPSGKAGADRAFIYDLKTATTISDYIAECDATNTTLTFKYFTSDNLGSLNFKHIAIVNNERTVQDVCTYYDCIKNIVFDESFKKYAPTSLRNFFKNCKALETISNLENLNTTKVTDMSYMFNGCNNLSSLDLSYFNTTNVTNMKHMFEGCKALTSLDLTNFNTEKVTDMACMFFNCQNLSSLALSYYFNTTNVTNMISMFYYCQNLSSLDLSYFNTTNVTDMYSMFKGCSALTSLDLTKFNTAKVTDMSGMFYDCKKLSLLDLTNFNTAKVTNMSYMFNGCSALTSLDLTKFNTANVTNMSGMFYNCQDLSSLNLSKFNTENVTKMYSMFNGCPVLTSLDLTNFNTAKVTDMSYMFYGCSTLQTIYVSDNFVVTGITNESFKKNLFTGCEALPEHGDAKTSSDYANYKTGYFTKLVVRNGDERYGIKGETTQLTVDNLVLADNKDLVVFDPFKATAASYNRTINTTWATLCLPFEVSLEGQNFRAFKLLSADEGSETVELEEIETSIEAGTPVIIKMKDGETKLKFSVENTAIAKDIQTAATADGNYQLQGLYTQKEFDKVADNNCYIVKGNKLMNPTKLLENTKVQKVASKPFRAYMVDKSSSAAGAKMFSIGISDSTTAIDSLNTIANDKAEYYDLHGKRLNEPQKGINIVKRGGKTMKVIIK